MLVAHITDPHLGLDTRALPGHPGPAQALRNALRHVQSVDPVPEVLLLTGDLTESGAEADFRTLRQVLDETLPSPQAGGPLVLAVLGNHDDRATAQAVLGHLLGPAAHGAASGTEDGGTTPPSPPSPPAPPKGLTSLHTEYGGLHFIGLDTMVPGHPHGELDDAQLDWLAATLAHCTGQPVMIFMHHPPLTSGMAAMDACGLLRGRERLAELVRAHGGVQLIAAGHMHRGIVGALGGAPVVVAPSCSHQLALDLRPQGGLAVQMEPPQVGLYRWTPQDGLACHFSHVQAYPGPFPV